MLVRSNNALLHRPLSGRLWKLLFAMAVIVVTVAVANCFLSPERAISRALLGHDFLAFYSAGKLVHDDRSSQLYDLDVLASVQREIATQSGLDMNAAVAPYWNPPLVALVFSPLSQLPFPTALGLWTIFGVLCLGLSALLLSAVVRESSESKSNWLLVPAAIFIAPPTIQALGHGQNTPLSLLLLTLTVLAWRAREPIWAGVACSLLFYKPQLAAIIAIALSLTLGWRVLIGALIGTVPQLLLTVTKLPGTVSDFLFAVPRNLEQIQFGQPYLWHRHVTLNGFFRFLLQGNAAGHTHLWITLLCATCAVLLGAAIVYVWWRQRAELSNDILRDRFIALIILSMPLLMPFYFDYDLLLLIVPAVLIGRERIECLDSSSAARWMTVGGVTLFAWTMFNPPVAEATGVSLTVPVLCVVVALQARRCLLPINDDLSIPLNNESGERLAA